MYKAQLDGRPVAVKVQRPDLLEAVGLDFYVARGLAAALTRLSGSSSFFGGRLIVRSDLVAAVDEYGSRLFEELDYRKEVRKMERGVSAGHNRKVTVYFVTNDQTQRSPTNSIIRGN